MRLDTTVDIDVTLAYHIKKDRVNCFSDYYNNMIHLVPGIYITETVT